MEEDSSIHSQLHEIGVKFDSTVYEYKQKISILEAEIRDLREQVVSFECLLKRKYSQIDDNGPDRIMVADDNNNNNNNNNDGTTKKCNICEKDLPLSKFSEKRQKSDKTGYRFIYRGTCSLCRFHKYNKKEDSIMKKCDVCHKEKNIRSFVTSTVKKDKHGVDRTYSTERGLCHSCKSKRTTERKTLSVSTKVEDDNEPQFESGESSGSDHVVNDLLYMGKITNPDLTINRL